MSLVLSTLLVASSVTLPSCSWDRPGVDPYVGEIEAAVDRYRDIPSEVRARLKEKMRKRAYDDIATITRDTIEGRQRYSNLRDMHFGQGRICREVTRAKWGPRAIERGLVYCEGEHCLIVPTVCRNVSRVTPDLLDVQTAHGREDPPESTPAAGTKMLTGQRFVDGSDPVQARALAAAEPPPADGSDPLPAPPLAGEPPLVDGSPPLQARALAGESSPEEGRLRPPTSATVPGRLNPSVDWTPTPLAPVTPVPEPSTWTLMALGMGLVGTAARRRRQAVARAAAAV